MDFGNFGEQFSHFFSFFSLELNYWQSFPFIWAKRIKNQVRLFVNMNSNCVEVP